MIRRQHKRTHLSLLKVMLSIAFIASFTSSSACQALNLPVVEADEANAFHNFDAPVTPVTPDSLPETTPANEPLSPVTVLEAPFVVVAATELPNSPGVPQVLSSQTEPAHTRPGQPEAGLPKAAADWLLPDSEVVYGPSAAGFSIHDYIDSTQGALKNYREWLESSGWTSAAQVIERVALENSVNPRLLLSLLEWECRCVQGTTQQALDSGYILGVEDYHRKSLYGQVSWAARSLAEGYYAQRSGQYPPDLKASYFLERLTPDVNAGTAALVVYFTRLKESRAEGSNPVSQQEWQQALDWEAGLASLHFSMFGNPWERDRQVGSLIAKSLQQPALELPFEPGRKWSFSSGPHPAWENAGALSALDFAPATSQPGCFPSSAWVTAVADGQVVRSEYGSVVLDLDDPGGTESDGYEGSGWAILYMHIAAEGSVSAGTPLHTGDLIGHPSCEGGPATGTHVHIARKYNGEWIAADSSLPFILSGWTPHNGEIPYQGSLTKDDQTVIADVYGTAHTLIFRPKEASESP